MHELGKTHEQRQVLTLVSSPPSLGRPFFTTQDVPPERVAALRNAFDATMKDEAFLAEAKQLGLDMHPMTADEVTAIVHGDHQRAGRHRRQGQGRDRAARGRRQAGRVSDRMRTAAGHSSQSSSPAPLRRRPPRADPIEDFYKGKTVTIVASSLGVGGAFDLTARALAKHMPKYIPGPARDDRARTCRAAAMCSRPTTCPTQARARRHHDRHSSTTSSRCIRCSTAAACATTPAASTGSAPTGPSNLMTVAWHTSGFKTARRRDARASSSSGATGVGSGGFIYPNAMNVRARHEVQDRDRLRHRAPRLDIALERGEIAGASRLQPRRHHAGASALDHARRRSPCWSQVGAERERGFPARAADASSSPRRPQQRQMLTLISSPLALGRPFFTTADVPADRVAALRRGVRRHHEGRRRSWPRPSSSVSTCARSAPSASPRSCCRPSTRRPTDRPRQGRADAPAAVDRGREICDGSTRPRHRMRGSRVSTNNPAIASMACPSIPKQSKRRS